MYRRNKYLNKKVKTSEGTFDSKKEYKRWTELKAMQERGEIHGLVRQQKYELLPSQRRNGKCVERACTYIADFVYWQGDELIVEDTKGVKTDAYIIKRKLMLYLYGIQIREL